MTYVAVAALVVLALTNLAWAGLVRSLIRQHARERDLLLNQLMHLAGRTWAPPPALELVPEPDPEPEEYVDPMQRPDWSQ